METFRSGTPSDYYHYGNVQIGPGYSTQTFPADSQYPDPINHHTRAQLPPTTSICEPGDGDGNGSLAPTTSQFNGASQSKSHGRSSFIYIIDENGDKQKRKPEDFRAEVEERTRNGESCEQIADALVAKGAHITAKSISRWRILWGFRKRAVRKQTKPPKPKEQRFKAKQIWTSKNKHQITLMTQQGLSANEIAVIMSSRGMKLTKGSSTILRLQSRWNLKDDEQLRVKNARYLARKKARKQQLNDFQSYAKELGVDDPEAWVAKKMAEPNVIQLRQDAAHKMMGDAAPAPKSKEPATKLPAKRTRTTRGPPAKRTRKSTNISLGDTADIDTSSNESEEESFAAPGTVGRTQRPTRGHVSTARNPIVVADDSDDGSTDFDGDPDYEPMAAWPGDNAASSPNHGYQPMMANSGDEYDEDGGEADEIEEGNSTDNQRLVTNSQPSLGDTTATTLPLEELKTMESMISSAHSCVAAAQGVKDILERRIQGRAAPNSLTGLPLSSRDIQEARRKLRELAESILNTF